VASAQRAGIGAGMSEPPQTPSPLVDAAWLERHLAAPDLVLLDARVSRLVPPGGPKHYVSAPLRYEVDGHIPGAVFADVVSELSDPATGLNFTLPPTPVLRDAFQKLGVNADSRVVAYDDDTGVWAARIWWLLRASGHQYSAVLNGGLSAWVRAGGELAHGLTHPETPGDYEPADPSPGFISLSEVETLSGSEHADRLLCALGHDVFTGERRSYPGQPELPLRVAARRRRIDRPRSGRAGARFRRYWP
jgi:thiosulfate/3-mercaptopyruvate sulfurtransferase